MTQARLASRHTSCWRTRGFLSDPPNPAIFQWPQVFTATGEVGSSTEAQPQQITARKGSTKGDRDGPESAHWRPASPLPSTRLQSLPCHLISFRAPAMAQTGEKGERGRRIRAPREAEKAARCGRRPSWSHMPGRGRRENTVTRLIIRGKHTTLRSRT